MDPCDSVRNRTLEERKVDARIAAPSLDFRIHVLQGARITRGLGYAEVLFGETK